MVSFITKYQELIDNQISQLTLSKSPTGLYKPIEYVLKLGGKRIRPALCLAACRYFSESHTEAISAALGLEIFHNFTLLHDDIMDQASMRRGQSTVHKKWNENTAILSGDAMMVKACQYMLSVPDKVSKQVQSIFYNTSLEVCEGQQYDMDFESRKDVDIDEYLEMIRLKTAVLLGASLQIGSLIGGSSEGDAQKMFDFGESIGLAFQLQDDYLDVYGDPKIFGKSIGQDILANKKTFLLLSCFKHANNSQLKTLNQWIEKEVFNKDEKIQVIKKLYADLHIDEKSKDLMNHYFHKAINTLNQVKMKDEFKKELQTFAMNLMNRNN